MEKKVDISDILRNDQWHWFKNKKKHRNLAKEISQKHTQKGEAPIELEHSGIGIVFDQS